MFDKLKLFHQILKFKDKITFKNLMKLTKKSFVRNVITVATGVALAQVIAMVFSPIITRIYGPEAFGVLGVFTSILAVFTPIAALTYPVAIVLPKKDVEAKELIYLSFYITIIISIVLLLLFVFFKDALIRILQLEDISGFLLLIPITMFFAATRQIVEQWLIRKKRFKVRANVAVVQALVLHGSKVVFGLFIASASTLIVITTLGYALHTTMLILGAGALYSSIRGLKSLFKEKTTKAMVKLARKYYDFPKYRAPQVFINGLSESLPVLMLTGLFGPASAGFYTIGKKVLQVPTQLIGNSIGDVFYPRITEAAHKGENIQRLLLKANFALALIGLFPLGTIILFGPQLFSFVFGASWDIAGEYARWMALWIYFVFITRPTIKTLPVIGAQKFHLFFTIITILGRFITLLFGGYILKSDIIAIALFSVFGSVMYFSLAVITILKSGNFRA